MILALTLWAGAALGDVLFFVPQTHLELADSMTAEDRFLVHIRKLLDNIFDALERSEKDSPRKFTLCEVAYVKLYIESPFQDREKKIKRLKDLVADGKLEFANGGLGEVDSANAFGEDIWANWFYGLQYLEKTLGVRPKIAWHMHQRGQTIDALRVAHSLGFTDFFIAGIADDKFAELSQKKQLQFRWDLEKDRFINTHIIREFSTPRPVDCDIDCDPEKFDPRNFRDYLAEDGKKYAFDFLWLIGGTYNWQSAENRFKFIEHAIREGGTSQKLQIATPSMYLQHLATLKNELPVASIDISIKKVQDQYFNGGLNLAPRLKQRVRRIWKMIRAAKNYFGVAAYAGDMDDDHRTQIATGMEDLCYSGAKLLHHVSLSGEMTTQIEERIHVEITRIESQINELYMLNMLTRPTTCDFMELELQGSGCDAYLALLNKKGAIPIRVFNPTLSRVSKLQKLLVPNDAHAGKYYMMDGKKELPSTLVCFRGKAFCSLYYHLNMDASLSSRIIHLRGSGKSKQLMHRKAPREFKAVGIEPIFLRFSSFLLTVRKDSVTVTDLMNPRSVTVISVTEIRPKRCSPYKLTYEEADDFTPVGKIASYSVFRTQVIEGVLLKAPNFELMFIQRPYGKHFSVEVQVEEDTVGAGCRDTYFSLHPVSLDHPQIKLDGSEMPKKSSSLIHELISPVKGTVTLLGSQLGTVFFTNQPRGVYIHDTKVSFGLGRSINGIRNAPARAKFTVYSFSRKEEDDVISSNFDDINRNYDVEILTWFFENESPRTLLRLPPPAAKTQVDLPPCVRFNTEFLNGSSFLIRFENRSLFMRVYLNINMIVEDLYRNVKAWEVSDATVFKILDKKPLKPLYELGVDDSVTVLIEDLRYELSESR
jgi:hypothetical protein